MDARQTARIEPLVYRDITQRGKVVPLTAPSLGVFNYKSTQLGDGSHAISYFTYGEKVSLNRTGYTNAMTLSPVGITQDIGTGRETKRLLLVVEIRKSEQLKNVNVTTRQENGYHFEEDVRRPFYMCTIFENDELIGRDAVKDRLRIKSKIDLHYVRNPQSPQNEPEGAAPIAPNLYLFYNVHIRYRNVAVNEKAGIPAEDETDRAYIRNDLLYPTDPWDEDIRDTGRRMYSGKRRDALSRCGVIAFQAALGSRPLLSLITRGHPNRDDIPAFLDFPTVTDSSLSVSKYTPYGGLWFRGEEEDLKLELGGVGIGPCLVCAVASIRTMGDESAGRDYSGSYSEQVSAVNDGYVAYFAIPLNDPDILRPYTFIASPVGIDVVRPKWVRMELDSRGKPYLDNSGKTPLTLFSNNPLNISDNRGVRAYFMQTLYFAYLLEDTLHFNYAAIQSLPGSNSRIDGVVRYHTPFDLNPAETRQGALTEYVCTISFAGNEVCSFQTTKGPLEVPNNNTYISLGHRSAPYNIELYVQYGTNTPTSSAATEDSPDATSSLTRINEFDKDNGDAIVFLKDVSVDTKRENVRFRVTASINIVDYKQNRVDTKELELENLVGQGYYLKNKGLSKFKSSPLDINTIELGDDVNRFRATSSYKVDPAFTVLYLDRDDIQCIPRGALVYKRAATGKFPFQELEADPDAAAIPCPPGVTIVPPAGQRVPFIDTDVFEFEYEPCPDRVHQHHRPNPLIDCVITESNEVSYEWKPLYRYYPQWLRQVGVTDDSKGCLPAGNTVSKCIPPPCGELTSLYSQSQRGLGGILIEPKILDAESGDEISVQHYEFIPDSGTLTFRNTLPEGSYDLIM